MEKRPQVSGDPLKERLLVSVSDWKGEGEEHEVIGDVPIRIANLMDRGRMDYEGQCCGLRCWCELPHAPRTRARACARGRLFDIDGGKSSTIVRLKLWLTADVFDLQAMLIHRVYEHQVCAATRSRVCLRVCG